MKGQIFYLLIALSLISCVYRKEAHKFFDKFLLFDKVS